ncbi:glutamyl-tRNA reductase [Anaerobacterium chartisolvens]|uniref:Glutamyl-tRNA reductase n=1 Tax=Anaerobacterium chartisolvens TaxID=1297424 RepID=A0A369BD23_9FIRM|nr:glutamyl-tRNA reductase [Anaerobacterium chartisolvens]RCX17574.1 glutamyl-tRNA reductase [Anaerobacterium chartisolvens]
MNIYVTGINYKTTPIQTRELLSFNKNERIQALKHVFKLRGVEECILLSTCNRTEIYIYSQVEDFDVGQAQNALCRIKELDIYELKKYFYVYGGVKAAEHLFNVASGLDSMVLGEDQILGQVKEAHDIALEARTSSSILNTLFREAITAAKEVKTNTGLSHESLSIGSLAAKLLEESFKEGLSSKCALVIGTGKMGFIAFKNLLSKGVGKIYATTRAHGTSRGILGQMPGVIAIDYDKRYSVLNECDIVISSTSSPHYTLTKDMVEKNITVLKQRVFIDMAVPRDMDELIGEVEGISCYNIDSLKCISVKNLDRRIEEASKAGNIIREFVEEYEKWYEFRSVLTEVKHIRELVQQSAEAKIEGVIGRLKQAGNEDKEMVRAAVNGIVGDIINRFIYNVRDNACNEDMKVYFRCLAESLKNSGQEP